ncbi:MAG: TonB-dependent receptor [Ferruginibacter sp.]
MKYYYNNIKLYFLIIFSMFFSVAGAQFSIKGKVVDAVSRQPLENVSITIAHATTSGTLTDQYGNFNIKASKTKPDLLVSYIGYQALNVSTEGKNYITIEMKADAVSLKDVVVLSSNNAAKFSTLAKIDLDLKPVRNTQELLRLVPGLFIAQHAGGGKAEQIFLRGFDNDHGTDIQVSVDGLPVNMVSHAHGQGYADSHFIIPETINNIDFGTGPYYTQHGNLNTSGYVAFSTFNNIPKSRVQIEAGRYNTFRALAMIDLLKKNKDKQSAYIASDFYYTDGATINKQNFNRFNIFGKYNLAISNNTQLTASLSGFKSKWDASGQIPLRAVEDGTIERFGSIDPTEGGNTERYNANFMLAHTFSNGTRWENQAYYTRNIFSLYSNFTFYLADPVNGDEINQREKRNLFGYLSKLTHKTSLGAATLTSTYGAGIRYDASNASLATAVKRRFLDYIALGDIKEANSFAFIQQQVSSGKWLIDAGVRFDYFHFSYQQKLNFPQMPAQGKSIVSPKLNIQYTVNSKAQLYVKLGKGFHSNDTRVVVPNEGRQILPAAYGADLGFIFKPVDKLFINAAAWYLYLQQEFVYVGDAGIVEPGGKSRREGIDIITRYQFNKNIFANVNLNFTKPRAIGEPKGADYIPLAPTATSTGGIFYKPKEGFNGSLSYRVIKSRPANEDGSITAKGYFVMDASVNYAKPKYEVGIAIENLLNTTWNEAQFATESRLKNESASVTELHFTPGIPFFARVKLAVFF